jgi:hypothetical protein
MLRDALARVLQEVGSDEVSVQWEPGEAFDAAIVSRSLPVQATAGVVFSLPARRPRDVWRVGVVEHGSRRPPRDVDGLRGLLALLDEYVPVRPARSDVFVDPRVPT